MRQRLILSVPAFVPARALGEALAGGDVAAVVLQPDAAELIALVAAAQEGGAAALVAAETWPAPGNADGLHAPPVAAVIRARPDGAVCGAAASSRHEAMLAGEAGADYVWFDGAGDPHAASQLGAWWQALFETPAVVAGPMRGEGREVLMSSGAEFVAMEDAFGAGPDEIDAAAAADAVRQVNAVLDAAAQKPSSV